MRDDQNDVEIAIALIANRLISSLGSRRKAAAKAAKRVEEAPDNDHHAFWKKAHALLKSGEPIPQHRGYILEIPSPHDVHYERIAGTAEPGAFRLPHHVIHGIGAGDYRASGMALRKLFGVDPESPDIVPAETVRRIGGGDVGAGHDVLKKFVAGFRRRGSRAIA
jgi:hypothetical protein